MKILIANRGEIAIRIIKACKKLGHSTVAIYPKIEEDSLHVELADESICIGNINEPLAYLNVERILSVAYELDVDAIHPGYGFLSEQAFFVKACEDIGVKFIGPSSDIINLMGDKINAINKMKEVGVPTVPGVSEPIKNDEELVKIADSIGYPVILKAANGGGGKGLRVVYKSSDVIDSFQTIRREMNDTSARVFVEKYFDNAKHVEVQVIGDKHNNAVHFYNRDCSMQRNNQKIIEEAPALISEDLAQEMYDVSVKATKEIGYVGAGTFEYLVQDNKFYFLEMNTRIQVEHPISEMITSHDLLQEQISVCLGEPLSKSQNEIESNGHSIEIRVNAEDPFNNFMPTPGKITKMHLDQDTFIRNDFALDAPATVKPFYDSMIGKIIVRGKNRDEAIKNLLLAIDEFRIEGIKTTVPFQKKLLNETEFLDSTYKTNFIANNYERLVENV